MCTFHLRPCSGSVGTGRAPAPHVEKLYDGLAALGTYLLIAFEWGGMPVSADFDIGDDR